MSDGLEESAEIDVWTELLAATRDALANLRADDLEDLAKQAERLVEASFVQTSQASSKPTFSPQLSAAVRERRLLGELLHVTNSNLKVLRRLHCPAVGGEVNSQWVR